MSKKIYIFIFLSSFLFSSVVSAETFFRNLKLGDFGEDVKELQKILNSEQDTLVSISGDGSLGQETNYFGFKTEQAVIKFQSKYKDEILTPNGLSFPTGFVGPATRQKLNSLISANSNNQNFVTNTLSPTTNKIPSNDDLYFAELKKQYPNLVQTGTTSVSGPAVLIHVFPQYVKSGEKIRLYTNLSEEKIDIFIDGKAQKNIEQDKLGFFEVTVPNLSVGQYNVYFEKNGIKSNSFVFNVISKDKSAPEITNLPSKISLGEEFKIQGNFLTEDTKIITSFGSANILKNSKNEIMAIINLPTSTLEFYPTINTDGIIKLSNEFGESETKVVKYIYEKN